MADQALFKTVMFGFEKRSVLGYIDEMARRSSEMESGLNQKIAELSESRQNLEKSVMQFESKMLQVKKVIDEKDNKIKSLYGMIENLNTEIQKQNGLIENKNKELLLNIQRAERLNEQARALQEKSKPASQLAVAERVTEKPADRVLYERPSEKVAEKVGEMIEDARQTASAMFDTASQKAAAVGEPSGGGSDTVAEQMIAFRVDALQLRRYVNQLLVTMTGKLDEIDKILLRYEETVSANSPAKAAVRQDVPAARRTESTDAARERLQAELAKRAASSIPVQNEVGRADAFEGGAVQEPEAGKHFVNGTDGSYLKRLSDNFFSA